MTAARPTHATMLEHFRQSARAPERGRVIDHLRSRRMSARLARRDVRRPARRAAVARSRPRRRHDAAREARLEARSGRARCARRAPAAGRRARLRHERQDDDDGDGELDPRAHASARLEPLRRQPRLGDHVDAARDARTPSSACSRSTSSRCRRSCVGRARGSSSLGNLFRDQLDRYGELEHIAERWRDRGRGARDRDATIVANADDPLVAVARRGTRARRCGSASTTRRTLAQRAPARVRLEVLRPLRPARTPTTRSTSAISARTGAPRCGHARPRSTWPRD